MISLGSLEDVVFILQVKRNDRGLISPLSFTTFLKLRYINHLIQGSGIE